MSPFKCLRTNRQIEAKRSPLSSRSCDWIMPISSRKRRNHYLIYTYSGSWKRLAETDSTIPGLKQLEMYSYGEVSAYAITWLPALVE